MRKRRLTSLIWRSMGETALFTVIVLGIVLYFLQYYGFLELFNGWYSTLAAMSILSGVAVISGIAFGAWQSSRVTRRLNQIHESMLILEKGNMTKEIPSMGEDEIGLIADQLGRIGKKWGDQVSSLQRLSNSNAELAGKARFTAIIEERQRLARELHDAVSQQLFAISMTSTALSRTMDKDFDKAKHQVSLIEEMASVAQSEMRALLLHLRPVHLEGKRLADGLRDLIRELQAKVPIEISHDIEDDVSLSRGIEDHLFRIVQEALSNTLRHSRATKLHLFLKKHGELIMLTIRDNGIGFDLEQKKHASYGIVSMQERVTELGGSINIITADGKGTRIDIRIPLIEKEGE